MEILGENSFDIEQFRATFVAKVNDFSTSNYILYGANADHTENERKKTRAEGLYQDLLNDCADALIFTGDKEAIMEIIHRDLVWKQYGNGSALFGPNAQTDFYRDLSLRLAIKASGI